MWYIYMYLNWIISYSFLHNFLQLFSHMKMMDVQSWNCEATIITIYSKSKLYLYTNVLYLQEHAANINRLMINNFKNNLVSSLCLLKTELTSIYPCTPWRLVDHDCGVRQSFPHPWGTCCQQECPHTAGLTQAPGGHWWWDVLHGVIDPQPLGHDPPRGVDIHVDRLLGVLELQEQELSYNSGGHVFCHLKLHQVIIFYHSIWIKHFHFWFESCDLSYLKIYQIASSCIHH